VTAESTHRHIGLFGATAVGVGAIVGGGILALAGVAFATTGPSAILAFALNGGIAFLTAASFAELGARFPHSGGTYTYAKRVLSIEVAFFAAFAVEGASRLLTVTGVNGAWLEHSAARVGIALSATAFYALALVRSAGGGGNAATVGKVLVFAFAVGPSLRRGEIRVRCRRVEPDRQLRPLGEELRQGAHPVPAFFR
jgi:amino acid transporter